MKFEVIEWKGAKSTTIFEGELDSLQFRQHDTAIGSPNWIRYGEYTHSESRIIVSFDYPSNIRVEVETNEDGTRWGFCMPAIDSEGLEKLTESRKKQSKNKEKLIEALR